MLIMIIGVPGTGKSTLANKLLKKNFGCIRGMVIEHYEADMVMINRARGNMSLIPNISKNRTKCVRSTSCLD